MFTSWSPVFSTMQNTLITELETVYKLMEACQCSYGAYTYLEVYIGGIENGLFEFVLEIFVIVNVGYISLNYYHNESVIWHSRKHFSKK